MNESRQYLVLYWECIFSIACSGCVLIKLSIALLFFNYRQVFTSWARLEQCNIKLGVVNYVYWLIIDNSLIDLIRTNLKITHQYIWHDNISSSKNCDVKKKCISEIETFDRIWVIAIVRESQAKRASGDRYKLHMQRTIKPVKQVYLTHKNRELLAIQSGHVRTTLIGKVVTYLNYWTTKCILEYNLIILYRWIYVYWWTEIE